jgi:hypothetical protein
VIWNNNPLYAYRIPLAQLAHLSQQYFLALAGTQLAVVLLAAPAATAGAICLDRTRGTLAHMLLTDLSDAEIVLGKLAARLVPVLTLIACTLPVMELLTLIGGLEPVAVLGTFVVTVGVAVLGCSLAMVFSLWLGKTHVACSLPMASAASGWSSRPLPICWDRLRPHYERRIRSTSLWHHTCGATALAGRIIFGSWERPARFRRS